MRTISSLIVPVVLAACGGAPSEPPKTATAASEPAPPAAAPPAAPTQKAVVLADLDRAVDPCADFYGFANGTWRKQNPAPAGRPRWSRRVASTLTNRADVLAAIQDAAARPGAPGTAAQLVGDQFAACMDEAAVDKAGLAPLQAQLAELDAIKTPADLQRAIRHLHLVGVTAPFGTTGAYDYREPATFQLSVTGGGLGLPDKDAYAKPGPEATELRAKYRAHVAKVLVLGGLADKPAASAADAIVKLETRLAAVSLDADSAGDPAKTDHKTTYAQLKAMAPHVEWDKYFDEAGLAHDAVNVAEPKHLAQVEKELKTTPIATWKAYLRWQLLEAASPWLARPFADESFAFRDKVLNGADAPAPRAQRCADLTETLLPEPVGKLYADKHFPPAAKAKAKEIAQNLVAVLKESLAATTVLTPETRKKALEKLELTSIQVGYPDTWKDTSKLELKRDALWANIAAARAWGVADVRRQIGKPTDRKNWNLPASSFGAYLDVQLNELVIPAGFLQPPYFDVAATDAMNYGAFGVGLAHDITHAYDFTGAVNDAAGHPKNWWTDADRAEFAKRTQCIVDQYEAFEIEPGVHHNGKLVLDEALGDQTGIHASFLAFKRANPTAPTIDGFTPEQQFFLAWGQFRGDTVPIEAARRQIKGDIHAVPKFRVLGPLSNSPEFAQAFSCKAGAPMVRANRCVVW
jgi:endothelin-converting enzyme/putative endopeptidase